MEIIHALLPHLRLHLLLLQRDLLRLLKAQVHSLPLPVQIRQHVSIRDGGAVLALFDTLGALSLFSLALVAL